MHDPDQWQRLGVHWHAYTEVRIDQEPSSRATRLSREPDEVLADPRAVAEWLAQTSRKHSVVRPVKLLGSNAGWGEVGDDRHLDHDLVEDEIVACRGDSLYVSLVRDFDRLDLWVEAVTAETCSDAHHDEQ